MKKLFVMAVLAILLAVGFVSCNSDAGSSATGDGKLVKAVIFPLVQQSKAAQSGLSSSVTMTPTTFKYQAKPASGSANMQGATSGSDWESLTAVLDSENKATGSYQTGTRFSVGQWNFTVRGFNENGGLVYEGTLDSVLLKTGDNAITINMSEKVNTASDAKAGTVNVSIVTPKLVAEGSAGTMKVSVVDLSSNTTVDSSKTPAPTASSSSASDYTFTASYSLNPGTYIATVSYSETAKDANNADYEIKMSDSVVAFRVVEDTVTTVSGCMKESLYANSQITMISKSIKGTLSYEQNTDKNYVCTFTSSSSESTDYLTPTGYTWYVDGVAQTENTSVSTDSNTATFTYKPNNSYGNHSITCVAIYKDTSFSSIFSKTISIEVKN